MRSVTLITLLALAVAMLASCAPSPKRIDTGGTASRLDERGQTAVPPAYPPAYPKRHRTWSPGPVPQSPAPAPPAMAPAASESPTPPPAAPPAAADPAPSPVPPAAAGGSETDWYPPGTVAPHAILEHRSTQTATSQPSSSEDIIAPENVGRIWIGLCLLAAFAAATVATVTPMKRFYLIAAGAAVLASLGLVPPAHIGLAFLGVCVVLMIVAGVYVYRAGMWKVTANQISKGAERVKKAIGGGEEFNLLMQADQTVPKSYIRKAQGK